MAIIDKGKPRVFRRGFSSYLSPYVRFEQYLNFEMVSTKHNKKKVTLQKNLRLDTKTKKKKLVFIDVCGRIAERHKWKNMGFNNLDIVIFVMSVADYYMVWFWFCFCFYFVFSLYKKKNKKHNSTGGLLKFLIKMH